MIHVTAGQPVWAMGLMSGTSMDGVDAALVLTDGETVSAFGPSRFLAYARTDLMALPRVVEDPHRHWKAARDADRETVEDADREVVRLHARGVVDLLADSVAEAQPAVVGFPGQTVAHYPETQWTWQIGTGERLARALNRPVVWDFRSQDLFEGGQGAPLAPFFHHALARRIGAEAPVAFLNIGGVANVTWVDPSIPDPADPLALVSFDTGPGNALINDWMLKQTGQPVDLNGQAAAGGNADAMAIDSNFVADFLIRPAPKSLDRNTFNTIADRVAVLSAADGAAVLTRFTVDCIAGAQQHMPTPPTRWLICGGGRMNTTMMTWLADRLDAPVDPVEAVGLDGDMLEAQAFAYLAVRVLRGLPTSAPSTTGCREPVCGGRISYPAQDRDQGSKT